MIGNPQTPNSQSQQERKPLPIPQGGKKPLPIPGVSPSSSGDGVSLSGSQPQQFNPQQNLEEVKQDYLSVWDDVPQEFQQYSSTTSEFGEQPENRSLPKFNAFVPKAAVDAMYTASINTPSPNPVMRNYTSNLLREGVKSYNRGVATGLTATNMRQPTPDLGRVAELQKIVQENAPEGSYSDFANSETVGQSLVEFAKDPLGVLTALTTESLASQAGALGGTDLKVVGAGALAGSVIPIAGTVKGAIAGLAFDNSLAIETASYLLQGLQEEGYDISDPESLKQAFTNYELVSRLKEKALAKGLPVAALDALSAGVTGSLGGKTIVRKMLREVPTQMALGGAGEAAGQIAAEGEITEPTAIVAEMLGEIGGSAPEITTGIMASNPELLMRPSSQTLDGRKLLDDTQVEMERDINNAPDWLKPELEAKLNQVIEAKNKLINKDAEFYSGFSDEDKSRVSEINQRLGEIADIFDSSELSEATKKVYEDEANNLFSEKMDIEGKYIESQTPSTEKVTTQQTKEQTDAIQESRPDDLLEDQRAEGVQEVEEEVRSTEEETRGTPEGEVQEQVTEQVTEEETTGETTGEDKVEEPAIPKEQKASIGRKRKDVVKKMRRGVFSNAQDKVRALTELRLHAINDPELASEVEQILSDASAKTPKVNPEQIDNLTQRVRENLNAQEERLSPDDYTPEKLQGSIERLPERIGAISTENFDKTNLKSSRTRFSRAFNDIRRMENINMILYSSDEITQDQFAKNQKALADERGKLADIAKAVEVNLEEATTEISLSNKDKASKIKSEDVTDNTEYQSEVQDFIDTVEESDVEDIGVAQEVADVLEDLENGFVPIGAMSNISNELKANIAVASPEADKSIKAINKMPKSSTNFFKKWGQIFNPLRKSRADLKSWVEAFRSNEFWGWDAMMGVGQDSFIYTKILNPLVVAAEKYREESSEQMNEFLNAAKIALINKKTTFKEFVKSMGNGRPDRIKLGMIMIEQRFRHLYNTSFWDKVVADPNLMNQYSAGRVLSTKKSERQMYQEAFDDMVKNPDGTINIDESKKKIIDGDRKLSKLHDFLIQKFDKNGEMADRQRAANQKRGLPIEFEDFYVPFIRRGGAEQRSGEYSFDEFRGLVNPKVASDRGKQIKDPSISAMDADVFSLFSDYVHQVNRDYYMTDPMRTAYKFFTGMNKKAEGESKTAYDAMSKALRYNIAAAFTDNQGRFNQKVLGAAYAYYLTSVPRFFAESFSEIGGSVFAGDMTTRMLDYVWDGVYSSVRNAIERTKGLELNENNEIVTTREFRSNFKKLLDITNSPYRQQFSRIFSDGNLRRSVSQRKGLVANVADMVMNMPNRLSLWGLWLPSFDTKFKELTGEDFDHNKVDDADYVKKYRQEIRDAGAYANKETARYKGFSSSVGGRTMNSILMLFNVDSLRHPDLFRFNQFLSSFGAREATNIAESFRDVVLNATGNANQAAQPMSKAVRSILARTVFQAAYPIVYGIVWAIQNSDSDDEWKREKSKEILDEYSNPDKALDVAGENIGGYASFLLTSKLGYASRPVALFGMGLLDNYYESKMKTASASEREELQGKRSNLQNMAQSYFYSKPINLLTKQYGKKTSGLDLISQVPGYGLAADYAPALYDSFNLVANIKDPDNATDDEKALMLLTYEISKILLITSSGTAIPLGKDLDRTVEKVRRDMEEEYIKSPSGRGGGRSSSRQGGR